MTNVVFVGSINLDGPKQVFEAVGKACGPYLKRIPDGETGGRKFWISWQIPVLRSNPQLAPIGDHYRQFVPLKIAPGVKPEEVHFGELGYAREARPGYEDLLAARKAGHVPAHVKFQVSLPTPYAVVKRFIVEPDFAAVYAAYEKAMFNEIAEMLKYIPAHDLAIQWDFNIEVMEWDGQDEDHARPPDIEKLFGGHLQRLSAVVPKEAELGLHFCYGDFDGKHFFAPKDATKMVELAHLCFASVKRPLTWIHMPVPIERSDDAFYKPFTELRLPAGTELYLGLVHAQDGVEGTKKRMATAKKYVPKFGIGSECGIARGRDTKLTMAFIDTYAGAAAAG